MKKDIKLVRTLAGDEILATVVKETETEVVLLDPLYFQILQGEDGSYKTNFNGACPSSKDAHSALGGKGVTFYKSALLYISEPADDVVALHKSMTESIEKKRQELEEKAKEEA